MQSDKIDEAVTSWARRLTRRRFISRGALVLVGAGTVLAHPLSMFRPDAASAFTGCDFIADTWGCYCAGTAGCGSCSGEGCSGRKRCNYWTGAGSNGNYCWCSSVCYNGSLLGYYSCCDCWSGGSGGCSTSGGGSACICRTWHAS